MGMIECKEICKNFGEKVALDHVSVEVPKGQIFGLLGPNGAGKTTLIRIINRITIPNGGEVLFDGRPITQRDVEKIGYLPEERGLYRKMEVGDQAMYLAQLKGMSAAEARAALKEWFVRFAAASPPPARCRAPGGTASTARAPPAPTGSSGTSAARRPPSSAKACRR